MERRFDMSDFEQSLKDHADQFKMTPSKRVWNGIYNNLHPGSRWPSITVGVVLVITLVTIGSLNNSRPHLTVPAAAMAAPPVHQPARPASPGQQVEVRPDLKKSGTGSPIPGLHDRVNESELVSARNTDRTGSKDAWVKMVVVHRNPGNSATVSGSGGAARQTVLKAVSAETTLPELRERSLTQEHYDGLTNPVAPAISSGSNGALPMTTVLSAQQEVYGGDAPSVPAGYRLVSFEPAGPLAGEPGFFNTLEPVIAYTPPNILAPAGAAATGIHLFSHKKNGRIAWTFYVNPTISAVAFSKKAVQPEGGSSSLVVLSGQPSFKLVHNSRMGMEAGAEMSLRLAGKFQLLTGLNLHYWGYNNVSNLVHPTFTTLNLRDGKGGTYSATYITHFGNGQSQDHINLINYSIEASIPLGVEYNIWGSQKIRVNVSSLLEPSVVIRDDAYLISSDGRYYVNDPLLVRRVNLEGRFGSYVTFIGRKIKWHVGPDFRYQLFSTYKNIYPAGEHLIDYGIRIGISR